MRACPPNGYGASLCKIKHGIIFRRIVRRPLPVAQVRENGSNLFAGLQAHFQMRSNAGKIGK